MPTGYQEGYVCSIDEGRGFVKVTYPEFESILSDWLPLLNHEYRLPKIGELVGTITNKNGRGICLGGIYSNEQQPGVDQGYYKNCEGFFIKSDKEAVEMVFDDQNYIRYDRIHKQLIIRADTVAVIQNKKTD
jgi:phage baseplate assembly protein gpV|nr:MAG TPA: type VI secretion protein [Caudoviricetes sp.]